MTSGTWHTATALSSHHSIIVTTWQDRWYRIVLDGQVLDEGCLDDQGWWT